MAYLGEGEFDQLSDLGKKMKFMRKLIPPRPAAVVRTVSRPAAMWRMRPKPPVLFTRNLTPSRPAAMFRVRPKPPVPFRRTFRRGMGSYGLDAYLDLAYCQAADPGLGDMGKFSLKKLGKKISKGAKVMVKSPGKFVAKTLVGSTVGLVSKKAGKKMEKGLLKQARISRGIIGFKKGLSKSELKASGVLRKVALVAAGAVLTVVTVGAAGPLLAAVYNAGAAAVGAVGGGISAVAGYGKKLAGVVGLVKSARKAAGIPPITAAAVVNQASAEQSANPSLSPDQALDLAAQKLQTAEVSAGVSAAGAAEDAGDGGAGYINGLINNATAEVQTYAAAQPAYGGTEAAVPQTVTGSGEIAADKSDRIAGMPKLAVYAGGAALAGLVLWIVMRRKRA